ncbi:uncharacterized protein LOC127796167 [Diospyros lotus]|uniref:uncharacterized protein LOC127796167 n=1 Tax=Diospyros lotus TaxID=55363 RepID=UPI00225116C3|nr:uncharacterized protein LOC127796167 [Diospyros lotus]
MEKTEIIKAAAIFLVLSLLVIPAKLYPIEMPPKVSNPLCMSQFTLANHACLSLPQRQRFASVSLAAAAPPSASPPEVEEEEAGDESGEMLRLERESREEDDCCKWVKAVDSDCICDMLVRLPAFLSRLAHDYTVAVDETCNVTYQCPGKVNI